MEPNIKKITLFLCISTLLLIDLSASNPNFYKTPNLYNQATSCRFDGKQHYNVQKWYRRINVNYSYGRAKTAWSHSGGATSLLNTAGNQNILYLMENVKKIPSMQNFATFLDAAQINHSKTNNSFGQLEFGGKFATHNLNLNIKQNFTSGLFLELLIPFKRVEIKNIHYTDKSPKTGLFSQNSWEWKQLKNNLNSILNNYNLKDYNAPYYESALGDLSLLLGWEGYHTKDKKKDIQASLELKWGLLFPTGHTADSSWIFSIGTGYDDHWGISLFQNLSITYKNWLTLNMHSSCTLFFDNTQTKNMKTFNKQQGFIKLAQGKAKEEEGTIWTIGVDVKANHFTKGLSASIGYYFNRQEATFLWPYDTSRFNVTTVNTDTTLSANYVNVLNFMIDYDLSIHMLKSRWAPQLNIFYTYPFSGHNIFKTCMIGAGLGFDVRWRI